MHLVSTFHVDRGEHRCLREGIGGGVSACSFAVFESCESEAWRKRNILNRRGLEGFSVTSGSSSTGWFRSTGGTMSLTALRETTESRILLALRCEPGERMRRSRSSSCESRAGAVAGGVGSRMVRRRRSFSPSLSTCRRVCDGIVVRWMLSRDCQSLGTHRICAEV